MAKTNSQKAINPEAGSVPASGTATQVDTVDPDIKTADANAALEAARKAEQAPEATNRNCERFPIVVLGSAEALPLLTRVWQQKTTDIAIIPIEVEDGAFSEVVDRLLADENIPDTFTLVPTNCFPTHRIGLADLVAYRVRRMKEKAGSDKWTVTSRTGLPFLFEATAALQTLERLGDTYSEEEFLDAYNKVAHPDELPEEIGMTFGNTVSYAILRPKCMATVAEALVRKRFICATGEGFTAIKDQLALLVKNE